MRHEALSLRSLDLVLDDRARSVAFDDTSAAPRRDDAVAPAEVECRLGVRIIESFQSAMPVDLKRPDPLDLHDRGSGEQPNVQLPFGANA